MSVKKSAEELKLEKEINDISTKMDSLEDKKAEFENKLEKIQANRYKNIDELHKTWKNKLCIFKNDNRSKTIIIGILDDASECNFMGNCVFQMRTGYQVVKTFGYCVPIKIADVTNYIFKDEVRDASK